MMSKKMVDAQMEKLSEARRGGAGMTDPRVAAVAAWLKEHVEAVVAFSDGRVHSTNEFRDWADTVCAIADAADPVRAGGVGKVLGDTRRELAMTKAWHDKLRAENARLLHALRYGLGCQLNTMIADGMTLEWTPESGIGVMLAALGCTSTMFDASARRALEQNP
jgi:hypothetical protein